MPKMSLDYLIIFCELSHGTSQLSDISSTKNYEKG